MFLDFQLSFFLEAEVVFEQLNAEEVQFNLESLLNLENNLAGVVAPSY